MGERSLGVKVTLKKPFAVVKETLERVGICNRETRKMYPSCYIIEEIKDELYKIYHFKELFLKEGKKSDYFEKEIEMFRRNTIIFNLKNWGMIDVEDEIQGILVDKIDVLKYGEKKDYRICHKYLFKKNIEI